MRNRNRTVLRTLPEALTAANTDKFDDILAQVTKSPSHLVLNAAHAKEIDETGAACLEKLAACQKENGKEMLVVNSCVEMRNRLNQINKTLNA